MYIKRIVFLFLSIFFIFTGCKKDVEKIVVASKPHSEQYILAEMIATLIEEHTDIAVEKKLGIGGGTSNIHPAMLKGDIDIYPEYTGTGWLFVLKETTIPEPKVLFEKVKKKYKEEYNIDWFNIYGFNNTYTLALKEELARKLGIESYSDLAEKGKELTFGAEYDFFEREDGYSGLQKVYGIDFKEKKELDIGLKYEAIASDKVDVINAFSTDALLKKYALKILKDDKNFFPSYQAATLIRAETLKRYPEIREVLMKLEGLIDNEQMVSLNYKVEVEKKDPKNVAKDFLKSKGLI